MYSQDNETDRIEKILFRKVLLGLLRGEPSDRDMVDVRYGPPSMGHRMENGRYVVAFQTAGAVT